MEENVLENGERKGCCFVYCLGGLIGVRGKVHEEQIGEKERRVTNMIAKMRYVL